jgi:hypothetical protein
VALLTDWSCSTFERRWVQAAKQAAPQRDLLHGRWEGTWRSDGDMGGGRLRCIARKLTDDRYEAKFHATYAFDLPFESTVVLTVRKGPKRWRFEGEADLGFFAGGVYRYKGSSDGQRFFSTYRAKLDEGVFEMRRVATELPAAATGKAAPGEDE